MNNKKVAIVIPTYKVTYNRGELLSFERLNKFLPNTDKYLAIPVKFKGKVKKRKGYSYVYFPDNYFLDVRSYCRLVNQDFFYKPFRSYKYMLLHQLDVIIFSSKLNYWCDKEYDYVGAPLFNSLIGKMTNKKTSPLTGGNGGFSLRKIDTFLEVIKIAKKESIRTSNNPIIQKLWFLEALLKGDSHKKWLKSPASNYVFNDDGFWSFEAPKYLKSFKVAPFKDALNFAFEKSPRESFKMNGNRLPFGAHAWEKYDKKFWQKLLRKF